MGEQVFLALSAILGSITVCLGYFFLSNQAVRIFCNSGLLSIRTGERIKGYLTPVIFLTPAILFLAVFLIYPFFETLYLSFFGKSGEEFVGLENYIWALTDGEVLGAITNNLLWLIFVPTSCTFLGLLIAVLTDRMRWGVFARTLIFVPMAISFVGAGVIWKFVYDYRSAGEVQIGLLNSLVQFLGGTPEAWITVPFWNNFFLMVILIWIQTGFAMVILSAALRGIPVDTLEAAHIDGANAFQIFWKIMVPQVLETIIVVWTTITILVLKVFDIVLTMTNGQWDTEVLANLMYDQMFRGGGDFGRASVLAILIMVGVIPIMVWNIRKRVENS